MTKGKANTSFVPPIPHLPGRSPGFSFFWPVRILVRFALSAARPWLWLGVLTGLLALGLAGAALAGWVGPLAAFAF